MNKTILSTALLTILSSAVCADIAPTTPAKTPDNSTAATPSTATQPAANVTIPNPTPDPANPLPNLVKPDASINCKYHLTTDKVVITPSFISRWVEKAAIQSFDFNPTRIDDELNELKNCYTDQGWQGFNDALKKSGNIDAIKSQHLTVSSQVVGEIKVTIIKDNQWKASVPLQVVYQNDKEKLTQLLTANVLVGRKISGDLGIMQLIATPQQATRPEPSTTGTATTAPPSPASADQTTTNEQKSTSTEMPQSGTSNTPNQ